MIYSILCIFSGIGSIFFSIKFKHKDKNLWDGSTTVKGLVGGCILLFIGIITFVKGW
jgi:hypothetical protein